LSWHWSQQEQSLWRPRQLTLYRFTSALAVIIIGMAITIITAGMAVTVTAGTIITTVITADMAGGVATSNKIYLGSDGTAPEKAPFSFGFADIFVGSDFVAECRVFTAFSRHPNAPRER
jgi:hypothetical protein